MSTLQERLRKMSSAVWIAVEEVVANDVAPTLAEAADALDAAAIDLSEAKRAWRYERDRADAAVAKLDAIDELLLTASNGPNDPEYQWLLNEAYRILHPEAGPA